MKSPFYILAEGLYRKLKPVVCKKQDPQLTKALSILHPLENTGKMYDQFQIRRLAAIITILTAGTVSAAALHLCSRMNEQLLEGAQLIRNERGAGNYKIVLHADTEEWNRDIPFLVEERHFSEEEKEALSKELYELLPDLIRKENQDLRHVAGNLNLISSVKGYPFQLVWSSTDNERLDRNGKVNRRDLPETGEEISLTVKMSEGSWNTSFTYNLFLLPEILDEEEVFFRRLEGVLQETDSEQKTRNRILLPTQLSGKEIIWEESRRDGSILLILLALLGSVLAGKGMENDLERSCKKRNRQLLMDYPGFVSKLRMYLSAGLTMKNAFIRITSDYEDQRMPKKKHYLCEEMKMACYQLQNGVMEEQVYRDWGKRCSEMRYRRLSFLLSVHLKQGNDQLLMLLEEEADSAQEDRRGMARKAGEEAGTRLLLPMMMMLVVVMFLVLLPAYMDFGGI